MNKKPIILSLIVFLLTIHTVVAQESDSAQVEADSSAIEPGRAVMRCQRLVVDDMKLNDTIHITAEAFGMHVAGFDLKFGIDSRIVTILEVLPGTLLDSCEWEYFTANQVKTVADSERPNSLWQAIGLARIVADTTRPECVAPEGQNSLVKVVVSSDHLSVVPDTTVPLFFFWESCSDNSISDQSGSELLISNNVYDYFEVTLPEGKDLLPTRKGVPGQCFKQGVRNKPRRAVDFHNGGVEFESRLGEEK